MATLRKIECGDEGRQPEAATALVQASTGLGGLGWWPWMWRGVVAFGGGASRTTGLRGWRSPMSLI